MAYGITTPGAEQFWGLTSRADLAYPISPKAQKKTGNHKLGSQAFQRVQGQAISSSIELIVGMGKKADSKRQIRL